MRSGLELHDSRVDAVHLVGADAQVHFPFAYIHKSMGRPGRDAGWSQETLLVIGDAEVIAPWPALPNTIADGYLQVGGIRHTVLPLPFRRKAAVELALIFAGGGELRIAGRGAVLELLGTAIYLEDY